MADQALQFKYIQDLGNIEHALGSVNAATLPELQQVVSAIYSFLQMLDSQDEKWRQLNYRISLECPNMVPKLQAAFLYYYTKCLEMAYFPNEETIKSAKEGKKKIQSFYNLVESDKYGEAFFKYFKHLFSGKAKAVEANELAANFIEDTFNYHAKMLNLNAEMSPDEMTLEDFFSTVADKLKDKPAEETIPFLLRAKKNENPSIVSFVKIAQAITFANEAHTAIDVQLDDTRSTIEKIKERSIRDELTAYLNKWGRVIPSDTEKKEAEKELLEIRFGTSEDAQEQQEEVEHEGQYIATQSDTTGGMEDLATKIGKWVLQQYPGDELRGLVGKI